MSCSQLWFAKTHSLPNDLLELTPSPAHTGLYKSPQSFRHSFFLRAALVEPFAGEHVAKATAAGRKKRTKVGLKYSSN